MLRDGDRVLVGLSGGPDSVALLYSLTLLKKDFNATLYIAHMDHMLRGKESEGDKKFCADLARKLKIEFFCEASDVSTIAKEKEISMEEAARLERYNFFKRVCDKKNIKKIAVAHNRDDQAETVLMRAIRGSGMSGLGGISPVRQLYGLTVIRPLIETSRKEIEEFIKEHNLQFRRDSSNNELVFTRNRIRHELLPYLEKEFNPNIKEVLANMAENLRAENDFLEKFSKRKFRSISKSDSKIISIDLGKFKKQPEAVRKRILRAAIEQLKGNLRKLTYQHWKEIEELVDTRPGNSIVDLPGGIDIVKNKTKLSLHSDIVKM